MAMALVAALMQGLAHKPLRVKSGRAACGPTTHRASIRAMLKAVPALFPFRTRLIQG